GCSSTGAGAAGKRQFVQSQTGCHWRLARQCCPSCQSSPEHQRATMGGMLALQGKHAATVPRLTWRAPGVSPGVMTTEPGPARAGSYNHDFPPGARTPGTPAANGDPPMSSEGVFVEGAS